MVASGFGAEIDPKVELDRIKKEKSTDAEEPYTKEEGKQAALTYETALRLMEDGDA